VSSAPAYHSRFGGLWTDRLDARAEVDARRAQRGLAPEDATRLEHWIDKGYVILRAAVPASVVDRAREEFDRLWRTGSDTILCETAGQHVRVSPELANAKTKVLDLYAFDRWAREAIFAEPIVRFLRVIFESDVLCFQSLGFRLGSEQGLHRDTAYVVVDSPLALAASWIALEDMRPGAGELEYFEGGHRIPEYLFSGTYKHWNPSRDGDEDHHRQAVRMHEDAARMGLSRARFSAKKGDALIWAADLPHGGSEIEDPTATRKSLVAHYCPRHVAPYYFSYAPEHRTVNEHRQGCFYSSSYYRLDRAR